jgi:DNA-binding winged helix-turn-helix (wHTH) protein
MDPSLAQQEIARMHLERGDVLRSIQILEAAIENDLKVQNYVTYLDNLHLLFRGYAEQLEFEKIRQQKARLAQLVAQNTIQLSGKTYYTFALCASYENKHSDSLELAQKGLEVAMEQDDKESVCLNRLGLVISNFWLERMDQAIKEIYSLQIFMSNLDFPQIRISSEIAKAQILRRTGQYPQALEAFWSAYEALKKNKNFYVYMSLLYGMANIYKDLNRTDEARAYVRLLQNSIDKDNMKRLSSYVDTLASSLGATSSTLSYDMVFNTETKILFEKDKGSVDFNNQFVLIDLFKLFIENPGVAFGKEELASRVWKQNYDAAIHDNKIYVTIKRLRQLIEPDEEKSKYVFRSKNGYYFSKDINILVENYAEESL